MVRALWRHGPNRIERICPIGDVAQCLAVGLDGSQVSIGVKGQVDQAIGFDEQGRAPEAGEQYRSALALNPRYADAHFNLALLCERMGESLAAVHHWKCYLKLDGAGQWAEIARRQLERLRRETVIGPRWSGVDRPDAEGA